MRAKLFSCLKDGFGHAIACIPFVESVFVSKRVTALLFQHLASGDRPGLQHNSFVLSPQVTTHDPPLKSTLGSKQTASVNTSPSLNWFSNLTSGNVNKENKGMCRTSEEQPLCGCLSEEYRSDPAKSCAESDVIGLLG